MAVPVAPFVLNLSGRERRAVEELKKLLLVSPSPSSRRSWVIMNHHGKVVDEFLLDEEEQDHESSPWFNTTLEQYFDGQHVSIWGVPLLLKDADERTDVILLNFLREKSFRVNDALEIIHNTLKWRKEFGIDALFKNAAFQEDQDEELEKGVFVRGKDKEEGHPVCYVVLRKLLNSYTEYTFYSPKKEVTPRERLVKTWILYQEMIIRKLIKFRPDGLNAILQVNDFTNVEPPLLRELNHLLPLLHRYYPQSIAKHVLINVPRWQATLYTTTTKFIFARPSKSTLTLFKYIPIEQVPFENGGLSVASSRSPLFTLDDSAKQFFLRISVTRRINISQDQERCLHVWELRLMAPFLLYGVTFVPKYKDRPVVILKFVPWYCDKDRVVSGYFNSTSPGTLVFVVNNVSPNGAKFIFRHKQLPYTQHPRFFICPQTGKLYTAPLS